MSHTWLACAMTIPEERRFREDNLPANKTQARMYVLLSTLIIAGFTACDYTAWVYYGRFHWLSALMLAMLAFSTLLVLQLPQIASDRSYGRIMLAWGLGLAALTTAIAATRTHNHAGHAIIAVITIFMMSVAVPNHFVNQLIVSLACAAGETLVLLGNMNISPVESLTRMVGVRLAMLVAGACGWQLQCSRKAWFLAQRHAQEAETQAEHRLHQRLAVEAELVAAKSTAEKAEAVAENTSRAKDHFLAVLSHELRTPLTPVVAVMSLLQLDKRLPVQTRDDLEIIRRNIELEVRLIDDLLDVSRIISGKLNLDKRPVDVAAAIRDAAGIVRGDMDAREQTLTIETLGAPYMTFGDSVRLRQVFWNLLRNATKFSPERSSMTIRARRVHVERCPLAAQPCLLGNGDCPELKDGNDYLRDANLIVDVIDHGNGIAPDMLPRLFNAFQQEPKARAFGGLGLGLSICKGVVEGHGGTISAASEGIGHGTTCTVRLPVAQCAKNRRTNNEIRHDCGQKQIGLSRQFIVDTAG